MAKVLAVFAHPNDEILWGYPYLQDPQNECYVYAVGSRSIDEDDKSEEAMAKVGEVEGWETVTGVIPVEFYRTATDEMQMPNLVQIVRMVQQTVAMICREFKPDKVITHNVVGENGNPDHRLVHEVVVQALLQLKVAIPTYTDICMPHERYPSYMELPFYMWDGYYQHRVMKAVLNPKFFARCRGVYEHFGAWKYDGKIAAKCGVYEVCG